MFGDGVIIFMNMQGRSVSQGEHFLYKTKGPTCTATFAFFRLFINKKTPRKILRILFFMKYLQSFTKKL